MASTGDVPNPINFGDVSHSDIGNDSSHTDEHVRHSSVSATSGLYFDATAGDSSPWNHGGSPFTRSPWIVQTADTSHLLTEDGSSSLENPTGLVGSLVREEGHIYSLAASGNLLYTGSDSKNIRVWKNLNEFAGFKSSSGLVKAIVIAGDRIFTGHQDGKIRVWKVSRRNPTQHKRAGSLPKLKDYLKSSFNPNTYVEARRHKRNALWIKHYDTVSCLSLNDDMTLIYSGSWDKTFKVWRVTDSKCLESVTAHDDAVNSVVTGFNDMVFTGSADGTVKVWRRELIAKSTKHNSIQTLLKQECAVTALAVNALSSILYCGSSDGLINFWEKDKQMAHGGVLRGHKLAVLCLAVAGQLILSGSADKTICVWKREPNETSGHSCIASLSGHTGPVKCLAIESDPDNKTNAKPVWIVYSGSLDKSVKVWKVSETL